MTTFFKIDNFYMWLWVFLTIGNEEDFHPKKNICAIFEAFL